MKERIIQYWRTFQKPDYTSGKVVAIVIALPAIVAIAYCVQELMLRVYFR